MQYEPRIHLLLRFEKASRGRVQQVLHVIWLDADVGQAVAAPGCRVEVAYSIVEQWKGSIRTLDVSYLGRYDSYTSS